MSKFKQRYCIESTRLQNWNYAWKGLYFVTINTKFHQPFFGENKDGVMHYSDIGNEVRNQWIETPLLRPDMNIILDEFTIMPNHFHGILGIGRNAVNRFPDVSSDYFPDDEIHPQDGPQNSFGPQRKNLSSVIRGFKASVTSYANSNNLVFGWHPRFHDQLIRDERALNNIRRYIRNNVKNWERDRFRKKR